MNILLISLFAVASLSTFPARTYGTELADKSKLTQQTVALAAEDHQPAAGGGGEIWQETEREVLIRNERGTKNINNNGGNGGGAGKKGKNKKEKKEKVITSDTQEQTGGKSGCRYTKSQWSECDNKSNLRSRTLTLKKGEEGCVATRTIEKKCKKACRYEKGAWSECTTGQMTRSDKLKTTTDTTCQTTRVVTKNCNQGKNKGEKNPNKERPGKNGNKEKGSGRKSRA